MLVSSRSHLLVLVVSFLARVGHCQCPIYCQLIVESHSIVHISCRLIVPYVPSLWFHSIAVSRCWGIVSKFEEQWSILAGVMVYPEVWYYQQCFLFVIRTRGANGVVFYQSHGHFWWKKAWRSPVHSKYCNWLSNCLGIWGLSLSPSFVPSLGACQAQLVMFLKLRSVSSFLERDLHSLILSFFESIGNFSPANP